MTDKNTAEKYVREALDMAEKLYKVKLPKLPIKTTTRKSRRLGSVKFCGQKPIQICINLNHSEESIRQTCYHEVAHVVAGADANHGKAWKNVMKDFGFKNPRATRKVKEPIISFNPKPKRKSKTKQNNMHWVRSFKGHPIKRFWYHLTKFLFPK
jgi:predicted SprT family Zn-dependent metalloprotease